jgi:hypothetical protein
VSPRCQTPQKSSQDASVTRKNLAKTPSSKKFLLDGNHDTYHRQSQQENTLRMTFPFKRILDQNLSREKSLKNASSKELRKCQKQLESKDGEISGLCTKIKNIEKGFIQLKKQMNMSLSLKDNQIRYLKDQFQVFDRSKANTNRGRDRDCCLSEIKPDGSCMFESNAKSSKHQNSRSKSKGKGNCHIHLHPRDKYEASQKENLNTENDQYRCDQRAPKNARDRPAKRSGKDRSYL